MNIRFDLGLFPAKKTAGFQMEDYYVWCGSCIRDQAGRYCLFASRWRKETGFPSGYMVASEIVLATTDSLDKPFVFEKVVLGARDTRYWDGLMAHNPQICKIGNDYVLFYIGTPDGKPKTRKIGYAHTTDLHGEWTRAELPIQLPENANNPAVAVMEDGSVYLAFRDGKLRVSIAHAPRFDAPYTVIAEDIFPKGRIEDMYLFRRDGGFEMIAEDNAGAYTGSLGAGVHFRSEDAVSWHPTEPMQVYDRTVTYTDGDTVLLQRRERPQLFFDEGRLYLFTTAKVDGETREAGGKTWNMLQEYRLS